MLQWLKKLRAPRKKLVKSSFVQKEDKAHLQQAETTAAPLDLSIETPLIPSLTEQEPEYESGGLMSALMTHLSPTGTADEIAKMRAGIRSQTSRRRRGWFARLLRRMFWSAHAIVLGLTLLVMFGCLGSVAWQLYKGKEPAFSAQEMALLEQIRAGQKKLKPALKDLYSGNEDGLNVLTQESDRLAQLQLGWNHLIQQDRVSNALSAQQRAELERLQQLWQQFGQQVLSLSQQRLVIRQLPTWRLQAAERLPVLAQALGGLAERILRSDYSVETAQTASEASLASLATTEYITRVLSESFIRSNNAEIAAQLLESTKKVSTNLALLQNGDPARGIQSLTGTADDMALVDVLRLHKSVASDIAILITQIPNLVGFHQQYQAITQTVEAFNDTYAEFYIELRNAREVNANNIMIENILIALAGAAIATIFFMLYYKKSQVKWQRRIEEMEMNAEDISFREESTQAAILRLMEELDPIGMGDLGMHLTVTEDSTGVLADAFNVAIEDLRLLVGTVRHSADQVVESTSGVKVVADQLVQASEVQVGRINQTHTLVEYAKRDISQIAVRAKEVTSLAERSANLAQQGSTEAGDSVKAMSTIREHIQDTNKRLKRLGETSLEIQDFIREINGVAEETSVLSLNAAIQASAAGEAGSGFSIVASQVKDLSEKTSDLSVRVEKLVNAVLRDIGEVTTSMENSTSQIARGTELAESSGKALIDINGVSTDLATHIHDVSVSIDHMDEMVGKITAVMQEIRNIAARNRAQTVSVGQAVDSLGVFATEMKESVSKFQLPDADEYSYSAE